MWASEYVATATAQISDPAKAAEVTRELLAHLEEIKREALAALPGDRTAGWDALGLEQAWLLLSATDRHGTAPALGRDAGARATGLAARLAATRGGYAAEVALGTGPATGTGA